jgi:hypothetical protein
VHCVEVMELIIDFGNFWLDLDPGLNPRFGPGSNTNIFGFASLEFQLLKCDALTGALAGNREPVFLLDTIKFTISFSVWVLGKFFQFGFLVNFQFGSFVNFSLIQNDCCVQFFLYRAV